MKKIQTKKGDQPATARDVLKELYRIKGVKAILIVGRDGFCIESLTVNDMDLEALSALFSTILGPYEAMGNDLKMGDLKLNMTEFNGGIIILRTLDSCAILGVVMETDTNLGAIRYHIKKISKDLMKTL